MWHVSTSYINCEMWQCAIFLTKRRFSALFLLTRTSPGANFHIGGRVCMELFTYEIMSEIIGLTHAKDCDVYSLSKTYLDATIMTYMDVSACKFSHERTCLYTNCPIMSYVRARPTCFHAVCRLQGVFMRVFTHKKTAVLYTFWLTKSCLCVTLNISHLVLSHNFFTGALETKYHITTF